MQLRWLAILLRTAAALADGGPVPSLTEEDFSERLHSSASALVAFVAPWCAASRALMQEFSRVHSALVLRSADVLVAQCDVSRETRLADRYRVWRTPVVLLFPDTQLLAPGLQVPFTGQLLHTNLLAFATGALNPSTGLAPRRVRSLNELQTVAMGSSAAGIFVGFFRSALEDGPLQGFWPLDCVRRHPRAFAVAAEGSGNAEAAEGLWRWAGLAWDAGGLRSEEGVVFVPSMVESSDECSEPSPVARFTITDARVAESWRERVDAFCAWCERQLLAPVAVFDATRAAALDRSFQWLLLLFAPRSTLQHIEEPPHRFPWERYRLERFVTAACAKDRRYRDLLPVLVPRGTEDIAAFRAAFGLRGEAPAHPMASEGEGAPAACEALREEDGDEAPASGPGRRRRVALWATVLFNTRTRRKYLEPAGAGWCPGQELALCHFTDSVLDGRLPPFFLSSEPTAPEVASSTSSASNNPPTLVPAGVVEVVGKTFGEVAVDPVVAGKAEVLLFLYAPWCGHSLNFFPLWKTLAAAVASASPSEGVAGLLAVAPANATISFDGKSVASGRLLLAQMDATRNEHLALPPMDRFPAVLLGVRSAGGEVGIALAEANVSATQLLDGRGRGGAAGVSFLPYSGHASVEGLRAWLAVHSAYAPPMVHTGTLP